MMVKASLLTTLITILLAPMAIAQQEEATVLDQQPSVTAGDSVAFGESLVNLAWENYPENRAYRLEVLREGENITQAKWDWLNDMNASFNINEGNISNEVNTNLFFPRYNFRFSISIGTFINTPSKVKQATYGRDIAEENVDQQMLAIRREVLSRYYTYLYNINLLKIRLQSYQDVHSSYTSATQSFQRGEIGLDRYNQALITKDQAQEGKIEAERAVLLSKLQLEEIIGMPLERAREIIRVQGN